MISRADFAVLHPLRVRWAECDAQGIVFKVNRFLNLEVMTAERHPSSP